MIVQNHEHGKSTSPPNWYDERPHIPCGYNEGIFAPADDRIPLTPDGQPDIEGLVAEALLSPKVSLPEKQPQYLTTHTPHQWLDSYIEYSRKNSPRGFNALHEACGLWLLSATVGGRVITNFGGRMRQTSLMIAAVARSSVWAKSHTIGIAEKVLEDAGLAWCELPTKASPQAIIEEMSDNSRVMEILHTIDATEPSDETRKKLEQELNFWRTKLGPKWAHEGQRAWHISEFGSKIISGMMRPGSILADFSDFLRDINEKVGKTYTYKTRGHGEETITSPYLAIIADTTPADLRKFAKPNAPLWTNGFFPRFAIIAPLSTESPSLARVPYQLQSKTTTPFHLSKPLAELNERLGRRRDYRDSLKKTPIRYSEPVWNMIYGYEEFIQTHRLECEDLDGSYARLALEQCVSISMLLALVEGYDEILPRHAQRAIECCERIRQCTDEFYIRMTENPQSEKDAEQSRLEDRIVAIIRHLHQKQEKWPTLRQIRKQTGRGKYQMSNEKLMKILDILKEAGSVEELPQGQTERYSLLI